MTVGVLVVDDSATMRGLIGAALRRDPDIEVLGFANDPLEAREQIKKLNPDVVTLDIEMPHMNGLEFISAVRSMQSAMRYMPLIMLTAHSDLPRLVAARDSGMTEFLCKPVTARSILARLEASILQARPFVTSGDYFGPDRRRRRAPEPPQRRRSDQESREI